MFQPLDESRLIRLFGANNVVLFLGAGFSYDTINKLGENFPLGNKLAEKIYNFLDYPLPYDNTPLQEMYTAFLNSGIKADKLRAFLENNLTVSNIPDNYLNVTKPFWYKIYTLNIDNVLDVAFLRANKGLQTLRYPNDDFKERDQSLDKTQVVYLNGKLPAAPNDLIFSRGQYASAQLTHQPLYQQFIYDYAVKSVIFVGTEISEPIFDSYLAARQSKRGREYRPKSYLITPSLSVVKADNYRKEYNVEHISGTTADFLKWLENISNFLPSKADILKYTFPNLGRVLADVKDQDKNASDLKIFSEAFNKVPTDYQVQAERSAFLMGASPTWNDIFRELDIPRTTTTVLYEELSDILSSEINRMNVFALFGTAGSGKSTILKRLALRLSQNGHATYLSYSDNLADPNLIGNAIRLIDRQVIICFDNAENIEYGLNKLITAFNKLRFPPIIILAARSSSYNKIGRTINPDVNYRPIDLPDLDDHEIVDLIDKLDKNRLLGVLNGKPEKQRFDAFKNVAKKQILIAMKEATTGRLFEDIMSDEFDKIEPYEAQVLAICIALNTERGFTNSKQDFVGFSIAKRSDALGYLNGTLKGTIIFGGPINNDKIMIRHRLVAEHFIKHCASSTTLRDAYIRVLSILAPELTNLSGPSRKFNLYRNLINHQLLYERFHKNIDEARAVYDSIAEFFKNNFQFWLQYGCLELEGSEGNFDLAENYINQAESLYERSGYVKNAKASLYYKKALIQDNFAKAIEYKDMADEISKGLLEYGYENSYIYDIYCQGRYEFTKKWVYDLTQKKDEIKHLISTVIRGIENHPFDRRLQRVETELTKALYSLTYNETPIEITVFDSGL